MLAPMQLDIGWRDLAVGALACVYARGVDRRTQEVQSEWASDGDAIACLSVRSGLDLYMSVLELPAGSEVLVSGLTIPDMPRILRHHGLVPIPVDLQIDTLGPNLEELRGAVSPRTRAILVAHLFGSRISMGPIVEFAAEHSLAVIEDCAQAFTGDRFKGHPDSDIALFSFGVIKTATALGGGLVRVQDPRVRRRMQAQQQAYPIQGRLAFLRRVQKAVLIKALMSRSLFTLLSTLWRWAGRDLDGVLHGVARSFPGDRFFEMIRQRPSAPLLCLLKWRLRRCATTHTDRRSTDGHDLAGRLAQNFEVPGGGAERHSYWVFPILSVEPDADVSLARATGHYATRRSSLAVVEPPQGASVAVPRECQRILDQVVFVPVSPGGVTEGNARLSRGLVHESSVGDTPTD